MPLDWWEKQKRLPDIDEEMLVLLKKKDYLESIRLFRREIFKTPEQKFWKVNDSPSFQKMPSAKPKLILAPSLQKLIREKIIKKRDFKLEDEILMPTDPEL